jgi:hypothetical protein
MDDRQFATHTKNNNNNNNLKNKRKRCAGMGARRDVSVDYLTNEWFVCFGYFLSLHTQTATLVARK